VVCRPAAAAAVADGDGDDDDAELWRQYRVRARVIKLMSNNTSFSGLHVLRFTNYLGPSIRRGIGLAECVS